MLNEQWRPVGELPSYYEVSSLGRVRQIAKRKVTRPRRILNPTPNKGGYLTVWMSVSDVRYARMVHLLVARAFIGPSSGLEVNHKDGVRTNNAVVNLEYVTRKENAQHAARMGLMAHGKRCHNTILTERAVREIRDARMYNGCYAKLASRFGVCKGTINAVRSGRIWRWVK